MLTVTEEMRRSGTLDEAGGAYRVAMLAGRVASAAHIEYHCLILQQYYLRRRLVQVLSEQLKAAGDMTNDVYDVVIAVQREIAALLDDSEVEDHLHDMPEVMDRTVREVEILDRARYNADVYFRSVADSARRAVYICQPYAVLPQKYGDKYDVWKTMLLRFDPVSHSVR